MRKIDSLLHDQGKSPALSMQSQSMKSDDRKVIYQAAVTEMALMLARSLDYSPTAEEIPTMAEVLTADLIEEGVCSGMEVQMVLRDLSKSQDRWPTTNQILEYFREEYASSTPRMYQEFKKEEPALYLPSPARDPNWRDKLPPEQRALLKLVK
mgnify:CR=1 FL=1